MAREIKNNT
ncbi:bce48643-989c-40bd-b5de-65a2b55a1eb5 [Thermothielavioides terrestris]|uniref:Bce48643-989c-40bd-b5de-65a2b55a1eb5 n=1 Tax=Thermothielavioides terrestris TaxID=2587410 RepID=A0A3S4D6G6_9PEZI|nr:bce48643-989c-40bd-b5de-65a2b55a1eb5 [Thermothielavioides terrestris]